MPNLAEKPEVPGLTEDQARAEHDRTGSRTSFAWTDPHTRTVWCRLPGCHFARPRRSVSLSHAKIASEGFCQIADLDYWIPIQEVSAHYHFRHLKQSRNRLPLCAFCDYSSSVSRWSLCGQSSQCRLVLFGSHTSCRLQSIGQHSIVHVQRSGTVKCKQECGKVWYTTLEFVPNLPQYRDTQRKLTLAVLQESSCEGSYGNVVPSSYTTAWKHVWPHVDPS